jgi:DNA-binding NtrC family response regulator
MGDMNSQKILIVDDESTARYGMRKALQTLHAEIEEAADGKAALEKIQAFEPDLVLCDINMPNMSGIELLNRLPSLKLERDVEPLIIVVTAYGSEKTAVEAMKAGAFDYLSKPYDIDELRLLVAKALESVRLKQENIRLRQQVLDQSSDIIGDSDAMQVVNQLIQKVAPTDVTVLITGESGVGKELVAKTIHQKSQRQSGPYVTMNCAAIPKDLVESELFGHEKGAFTGATAQRQGKFEMAHGGTLFLDEIADMSLETQAKILRVLEEKSFTRLGGKDVFHSDVRLISATNKILDEEIEKGMFRQDLYFRLKVIEINLPPLRQRREDIPFLVNHYLDLYVHRHNAAVRRIDSKALRTLMDFSWPGNVRQLIHVIEQSVVLAETDVLCIEDLPNEVVESQTTPKAGAFDAYEQLGENSFTELKEDFVSDFERNLIEKALIESQGNVSQAARVLKMKRQFLQTKMKNLGIEADDFR